MSNGSGHHEGLYRVRRRSENRGSSRFTRVSDAPERHLTAAMDRAEFFSTPNPRAWTPRTRADRPRSDHPSLSRRSIASDQDRNGYASTSPYGSPTRRSPPKDASPPRSPFDEERFQSIVGRRPGRRTSVDSAASSLRRGSLGSHSSIASMTENESAFDAGADDPASQSRLGVRHNASLSDLEHMHDNASSHGGSLGRESGASRASSIMSYASTISAGGGGSRARPPRDGQPRRARSVPGVARARPRWRALWRR